VKQARAIALGVWEFVVGEDSWTALGAVLALAVTGVLAGAGVSAWWVMPPAIVALLGSSVWRAARAASDRRG
jgi:hypothetical protein